MSLASSHLYLYDNETFPQVQWDQCSLANSEAPGGFFQRKIYADMEKVCLHPRADLRISNNFRRISNTKLTIETFYN